jgi:ribosomal protein S18 acetylase RimI-like enzyme
MTDIHEKLNRLVNDHQHERSLALVVVVKGQVVGYGEVGRWRNSAEIANLHIHEAWRNHGFGTWLIDELRHHAAQWHTPHLEIGVSQNNPHARRLYERLGFVVAYTRVTDDDVIDYLRDTAVTNVGAKAVDPA